MFIQGKGALLSPTLRRAKTSTGDEMQPLIGGEITSTVCNRRWEVYSFSRKLSFITLRGYKKFRAGLF